MKRQNRTDPKRRLWAAILAACLLLTGCSGLPAAREMGDMALLRVLGVDAEGETVAVTGSTGPQGEGEPPLVLTALQDSLSGACLAMQGRSDSSVFFGYVDQLLIGQELAGEGVRPVLDYFARDAQLGLGARVWLVREASAREAVSAGEGEGAVSRLENLQTDSKMGIAGLTRTAGEVYTDLLELGCAYLPAISPAEEEAQILSERGYAVLKGDALAGWLEDEAARGLELLAGGPASHIVKLTLPGQTVCVKTTSARTASRLEDRGDGGLTLQVSCRILARLSEYGQPLTGGELEQVRSGLEARERERLELALEQLRLLQTDCTGLGAKAAMACPARWQGLQEDWAQVFSQIPIQLDIQIRLEH